jgi:hypothetical protein
VWGWAHIHVVPRSLLVPGCVGRLC